MDGKDNSHLPTQGIPASMESEGSLLCTQKYVNGPYPQSDESSPQPQT